MRIGLTGGIASGKSTVADQLAELGGVIIDADILAREVVAPGTPGLEAVRARFCEGVLSTDGSLDRAALGAIVFADPLARRDLEAIIHPAVRRRAAELEAAAPPGSVVVHVIPLLVETGQSEAFDEVVVVDVAPQAQRDRLMARSGLSAAEADARIGAQATRQARLSVADHVLDNSRGLAELTEQVTALWRTWQRDPRP